MQADSSLTEDKLMEEAALALEAKGFYLDHSRYPLKVDVRLHSVYIHTLYVRLHVIFSWNCISFKLVYISKIKAHTLEPQIMNLICSKT